MTGIERLRDIADDRYSGGMVHISVQRLREICDQIEGEAGVETVKADAMEALAFVEEHGGLDEIKERLMPEGMEWPRFEDGELVDFGSKFQNKRGGASVLRTAIIKDCRDSLGGDFYWKLGKGKNAVTLKSGERVKRPAPKVLDADGVEIRAGDKVWDTSTGDALIVHAIDDDGKTIACRYVDVDGDAVPVHGMWGPSWLTHRAPVLAADGKPLREGQTVWSVNGTGPYEVNSIDGNLVKMGSGACINRCNLTHQRPVLDAEGNRIEPAMDVWWVCEGDERGIHAEKLHVESIGDDGLVTCDPFNGGTWVELEPSELYVHKPVLDADGVPIKEGDTVWLTGEPEYSWTVTYVSERHVGGYCNEDGSDLDMHSKSLTHTNPEPLDSWERIEKDAFRDARSYFRCDCKCSECSIPDEMGISSSHYGILAACAYAQRKDIVRRAKALAERGRR